MPFSLRQTLLSLLSIFTTSSQNRHRRQNSETAVPPSKIILAPKLARRSTNDRLTAGHQNVLLLHGPRQEYILTENYEVHEPKEDCEMLVKIDVIGLNPIDWKSPAYNFGLPAFPLIAGRDYVGVVVKGLQGQNRIRPGDVVLGISTDYRDFRKSAFQEYAVAAEFNLCRLPRTFPADNGPPIGVAFVAAALALGVCLGVDFSTIEGSMKGPDIWSMVHTTASDRLPVDVVDECLNGLAADERPVKNDWLAIWGSTATGFIALQLAKLAGLRVICVVDVAKHGSRLSSLGADLLVDRFDIERATSIITGVTNNDLRFALDTVGKDTASQLLRAISQPGRSSLHRSHLVGLTGLPKEKSDGTLFHTVPIKLFHSLPEIGEGLMKWLENLLLSDRLSPPSAQIATGGLAGINKALSTLRTGELVSQRIVVPL